MSDLLLSAVAGGAAGMTVDLVLYPLDTIKTRLQARRLTTGSPPPAPARGAASFYRGAARAGGRTPRPMIGGH